MSRRCKNEMRERDKDRHETESSTDIISHSIICTYVFVRVHKREVSLLVDQLLLLLLLSQQGDILKTADRDKNKQFPLNVVLQCRLSSPQSSLYFFHSLFSLSPPGAC